MGKPPRAEPGTQV